MSDNTNYYIHQDGILREYDNPDGRSFYWSSPLFPTKAAAWEEYARQLEDDLEINLATLQRAQDRVDTQRLAIAQAKAKALAACRSWDKEKK